jgi:hypothetical protein
MKKLLLLFLIVTLGSCSIKSRRYMKGWYVTTTGKKAPTRQVFARDETGDPVVRDFDTKIMVASAGPEKLWVSHQDAGDTCDVISLKNGKEIRARVVEITPTQIRYKTCTNPNGPIYVIYPRDVSVITYPNGETYVANETAPEEEKPLPPPTMEPKYVEPPPRRIEGSAIAALPLALLAAPVVLFVSFLGGLLMYALALLLGIIAMNRINAYPETFKGRSLASAGIIVSLISLFVVAMMFFSMR